MRSSSSSAQPLHEKFETFKSRYAIVQNKPFGPGGRMIPIVVGYQNLDELQARIQPYSFRVRLADCYDLPEKMYIRREVDDDRGAGGRL